MKIRKDNRFFQCENCSVWHPQRNMVKTCELCGQDFCDVCTEDGKSNVKKHCYKCEDVMKYINGEQKI